MSDSEARIASVLEKAKIETSCRDVLIFGLGHIWLALLAIASLLFKLSQDHFALKEMEGGHLIGNASKPRE